MSQTIGSPLVTSTMTNNLDDSGGESPPRRMHGLFVSETAHLIYAHDWQGFTCHGWPPWPDGMPGFFRWSLGHGNHLGHENWSLKKKNVWRLACINDEWMPTHFLGWIPQVAILDMGHLGFPWKSRLLLMKPAFTLYKGFGEKKKNVEIPVILLLPDSHLGMGQNYGTNGLTKLLSQ